MLKDEIKTREEYEKKLTEFKKKYPEYKGPKPIECLNLIMRKDYAVQILKGEKDVEFRAFSVHYCDRLNDKDVENFMNKYYGTKDEEDVMYFAKMVRPVKKIRFHNYSNSWFLELFCKKNGYVCLTNEDVQFLNDALGCHELDKMLADFNKRRESNRPLFFFFVCGKVIDTNLQV